jgi:hypothetical protein
MVNAYILLLIGGALGWVVFALLPARLNCPAILLVICGAVSSFAAGLIANGGAVFGGLSPTAIGASVTATLLTTGLILAVFYRRRA